MTPKGHVMSDAERERSRERTRAWIAKPGNKERRKQYMEELKKDPERLARLRAQRAKASARWRETNPAGTTRAVHIKSKCRTVYGMSAEDAERAYQRVLLGGDCDSCGAAPATDIDHCHTAKVFRGYLCHGCNTAAGYLVDDPVRASALATYLAR